MTRKTSSIWLWVMALSVLCLLTACTPTQLPTPPSPPDGLSELDLPIRDLFDQRHQLLTELLDDPKATRAQLARAYGAVGQVHFAYGYHPSAEAAFTGASQLAPDEPRWHYYRGRAAEAQGRIPDTVSALEQVLQLSPGHIPSGLLLAEIAAKNGDLETAIAGFEAILDRDPTQVRAWAGLSRLALERGAPQAAEKHLQEALTRQPKASPLIYQAAMIQRALGHREAAERLLAQIPAKNSSQVQLALPDPWMSEIEQLRVGSRQHDRRALRALANGQYTLAIVELRQALAANPDRIFARHGLGAALAKLGRNDEALVELRLLLDEVPNHVPTLALAASLLIDKGEHSEAAELIGLAREEDPENEAVLRQQARLLDAKAR